VGLGSFTSIVTDNGKTLNDYEIPISTGNTYTTGLLLEGIEKAASMESISLGDSTAAVVGASGNIGRTLSYLLSFKVGQLYLIGRGGHENEDRLRLVRADCLRGILEEVGRQLASGTDPEGIRFDGLAHRIYKDLILPGLQEVDAAPAGIREIIDSLLSGAVLPAHSGTKLDEAIAEFHHSTANPFIVLAGIEDLPTCDVVAVATNSTNSRLVGPDQVKKGAIVGCASVPSNLSRSFEGQVDDYFVFDGGFARLPEGSSIDFVGMPKNGLAFGCLSETLLLGFEGTNRSFSKGDINPIKVLETLRMAEDYGFSLGEFQLSGQILSRKTRHAKSGENNGNDNHAQESNGTDTPNQVGCRDCNALDSSVPKYYCYSI
jgi:predicted amino acid dehydrogenase